MDAHNTFIGDSTIDSSNENLVEETQMDLIMKNDKAFNWSDDDEKQIRMIKSRGNQNGAVPNLKKSLKKEDKNSDPDLLLENK